MEKAQAQQWLSRLIVGSPATVRAGVEALVAETGADELMIVSDGSIMRRACVRRVDRRRLCSDGDPPAREDVA